MIVGGAVNLTPVSRHYLDHIGALGGYSTQFHITKQIEFSFLPASRKLGAFNFDKIDKIGHGAIRITRGELLPALLRAVQRAALTTYYGSNLKDILEDDNTIEAIF